MALLLENSVNPEFTCIYFLKSPAKQLTKKRTALFLISGIKLIPYEYICPAHRLVLYSSSCSRQNLLKRLFCRNLKYRAHFPRQGGECLFHFARAYILPERIDHPSDSV